MTGCKMVKCISCRQTYCRKDMIEQRKFDKKKQKRITTGYLCIICDDVVQTKILEENEDGDLEEYIDDFGGIIFD